MFNFGEDDNTGPKSDCLSFLQLKTNPGSIVLVNVTYTRIDWQVLTSHARWHTVLQDASTSYDPHSIEL